MCLFINQYIQPTNSINKFNQYIKPINSTNRFNQYMKPMHTSSNSPHQLRANLVPFVSATGQITRGGRGLDGGEQVVHAGAPWEAVGEGTVAMALRHGRCNWCHGNQLQCIRWIHGRSISHHLSWWYPLVKFELQLPSCWKITTDAATGWCCSFSIQAELQFPEVERRAEI